MKIEYELYVTQATYVLSEWVKEWDSVLPLGAVVTHGVVRTDPGKQSAVWEFWTREQTQPGKSHRLHSLI